MPSHNITRRTPGRRHGLTLAELLIASTIMLMIATAVASLAATVHSTNDFCQGQITAAQHARVALSRIESALEAATKSEQFPGCFVVTEQAGTEQLPSTLVVWQPSGVAANPTGLPGVSEIVIFTPDPNSPGRLVEIRAPSETGVCPATTDMSAWRTLTNLLKTSQAATKVVLTDRLRTAPLTGNWTSALSPSDLRGVIRFRCLVAPTQQDFSQYRAGTRTWQNLDWPLDNYRATSGTRAVACQTEIQLTTGSMASAGQTALPFYSSVYNAYELTR